MVEQICLFILAMKWNEKYLHIDNYSFIIIQECIIGSMVDVFFWVPILSYFALITPNKIEGSIFALLTGVQNLALQVIAPMSGSLINDYILKKPVDIKNLNDIWKLSIIAVFTSLIVIPISYFVPFKTPKI